MELVRERFAIAGRMLDLERPGNPGDLVDEERFAADEYLPYWAEVWPAGLDLARHVASLELGGRDVLELGCGLGLPSLVAALGGARVTAADWSAEALDLLRHNACRNGAAVETLLLDWRDTGALGGRRFDVVLAADVLYEERNAAPVIAAFAALVRADGCALLADPGRRHAAGVDALATAAGLAVEELPHGLRAGAGRLLRLTRRRG